MAKNLHFNWVKNGDSTERYTRFFLRNVSPQYISFGEYKAGLALPGEGWLGSAEQTLLAEFGHAIIASQLNPPLAMVSEALSDGELQGVAVVRFMRAEQFPYAVLEDIVIDQSKARSKIGSQFVDWIEAQCRAQQMKYLSLETGISNHRAAKFFRRRGYAAASVVRLKRLF